MTPIAELKNLTCGYRGHTVLANLNLNLDRGHFYSLIGPNGSGKSTLLKTIAHLIPPIAGTIELRPKNLRIGYIPQSEKLDPIFPITVDEVVAMGAHAFTGPGRPIRRSDRAAGREHLRRLGIGDLQRRPFAELSGGQKQRVLLARALVVRPALLILDEPTSGVDPEAEETYLSLLAEVRDDGIAIVMASHNLEAAARYSDRIIAVEKGNVTIGKPNDLLPQPAA